MTSPKPGSPSHRFQVLRNNRKRAADMLKEMEASGDTSAEAKELMNGLMVSMLRSQLGEMLMEKMTEAVASGAIDEHGLPNAMPDDMRNAFAQAGIDPRSPEFSADPEATERRIQKTILAHLKDTAPVGKMAGAVDATEVELNHIRCGPDGWPLDMDPEQKADLIAMGAKPPAFGGFPQDMPPELVAKLKAHGIHSATMLRVPRSAAEAEVEFAGMAGTANGDGSDFKPTPEYEEFMARMNKMGAKAVSVTAVRMSQAEGEKMRAALKDAGSEDVNALLDKAMGDPASCECPACRVKAIITRAIANDKGREIKPGEHGFPDMPVDGKPH